MNSILLGVILKLMFISVWWLLVYCLLILLKCRMFIF